MHTPSLWKSCSLAAIMALSLCAGFANADSLTAADFAALVADRAAVEAVYQKHRTGNGTCMENPMSPAEIEKFVRTDLKKEAVLARVYGVTITTAMVDLEVTRIDTTTRAPEMLAEIKAVLGGDAGRFARAVARPLLVERILRTRFDNDDHLHAAQRHLAETARAVTLAAQKDGVAAQVATWRTSNSSTFTEIVWELVAKPADQEKTVSTDLAALATAPIAMSAKSGAYSVEGTAHFVPPPALAEARPRIGKAYFDDLDPELQNVLRVQLQKTGDVSAVIETPNGFLLFLAKEKTPSTLSVCSLTIHKRSPYKWLEEQPDKEP